VNTRTPTPSYWRIDKRLRTISARLHVQCRKLRLYEAEERCLVDVERAIELVDRAAARFTKRVNEGWRPAHGSLNAAQSRTRERDAIGTRVRSGKSLGR
jgi:hypothetical protein